MSKEDYLDPHQMTEAEARAFGASNAWETLSHRERACLQMRQRLLCMPFDVFHEAMEKALGRPVWTHEFGLNGDGLRAELFDGKPAPTMQEIMEMIPAEKRITIITDS